MTQKPELFVPKLRLEPAVSTSKLGSRSTSLKDKVVAKLLQPLKSRSKSSLATNVECSQDILTGPRQTPDNSRWSQDSGISDSISQNSKQTEGSTPSASFKPHIRIYSSINDLQQDSTNNIWTAIEVSGEVLLDGLSSKPLDIVVVFDCSPYASENFLENAYQVITLLARLLSSKDQLAILATCQRHPSDNSSCTSGCIVRQLRPPEPILIAKELRLAIERRALVSPEDVDLGENLLAAFRILGHLSENITTHPNRITSHLESHSDKRKFSSRLRDASPLVLVVSPNYAELCATIGSMAPVPVHIIHPGIVSWRSCVEARIGWKLSASFLQRNSSLLHNELEKLLSHARAITNVGELVGVSVEIEAAKGCSIKQIIGVQNHSSLSPGEILSLCALVTVPAVKQQDSNWELSLNRSENIDDLIYELECILGVASQEVLSVKVSCTHIDSDNERCDFVETGTLSIGRYESQSGWLGRSIAEIARSQDLHAALAYKRSLVAVANSAPLLTASEAVNNFLSKPQSVNLEAEVKLLLEEIDFQNMIIEKYQLLDFDQLSIEGIGAYSTLSPPASPQLIYEPSPCSTNTKRKVGLQKATLPSASETEFDLESSKENVTTISGEQTTTSFSNRSVSSNATTIHHELDSELQEEGNGDEDKARKIWNIIRRDSKSKQQGRHEASLALEGIGISDEKIALVRQRSIRSKRSIGADTFRSLSFDVDMLKKDRGAPWL